MAIKKRNQKSNKKSGKTHKNQNKNNGKQQHMKTSSVNTSNDKVAINGTKHTANEDLFGDTDDRLDVNGTEPTTNGKDNEIVANKSVAIGGQYSAKGLSNLGNTCYMNSVLQVLSETHLLFDMLNERSNDGYVFRAKSLPNPYEWSQSWPQTGRQSNDDNEDTVADDDYQDFILGHCLPLTSCVIGFMRDMRSTGSRTVSPAKLLASVRKEWSQFEGWAQQDSHELLRCLLDSLRCKEVRRQRMAVVAQFKSGSNRDNLDDDTKARIKSFATYTQHTSIDTVFGGHLLSSVCCDVCHNKNMTFESFFDISLSLTHLNTTCDTNSDAVIVDKKSNNKDKGSNGSNTAANDKADKPVEDMDTTKKLTPKERKALRMNKKAAKREAKQSKRLETNFIVTSDTTRNDSSDNKPSIGEDIEPKCLKTTNAVAECESSKSVDNVSAVESSEMKTEVTDVVTPEDDSSDWPPIESLLWDDSCDQTTTFKMENKTGDDWTAADEPPTVEVWDFSKEVNWDDNNGDNNDEDMGFGLLYDNEETDNDYPSTAVPNTNDWMTEHWRDIEYNADNKDDWNDEGYVWTSDGPKKLEPPVFGPQLPPDYTVDSDGQQIIAEELASDESKALEQELAINSTDIDDDFQLLCISDGEKMDRKQHSDSTGGQHSSAELDLSREPYRQILTTSLETIGDNHTDKLPNFELLRLLANFTSVEHLSGQNKYLCDWCTKANGGSNGGDKTFTNASRRTLIALPPPVLTLHLKRFEAQGYRRSINFKKINTFVSFPATFDLAPFVSQMYNYLQPMIGQSGSANTLIYSLYGVVQHSGGLKSGHYTAYVRHRSNNADRTKKFAVLQPFVPNVEKVLKMIEINYFNATNDSTTTGGDSPSAPDVVSNGSTNGYHLNGTNDEDMGDADGKWYHISDSSVSSSSLGSVLKSQAYILFYERVV